MSKAVTWDDDVFELFNKLKTEDRQILQIETLTISDFMRRLLKSYERELAILQAEKRV
jgi:hypothetical protein